MGRWRNGVSSININLLKKEGSIPSRLIWTRFFGVLVPPCTISVFNAYSAIIFADIAQLVVQLPCKQ